jgi:hypothetical protein
MTVLKITEPVVNVAPATTKALEMDIPHRFSIKTTEKETLSHWFHLMCWAGPSMTVLPII